MKKILAIFLLSIPFACYPQEQKASYLGVGINSSYRLLNDETIGSFPLNGISMGLHAGFSRETEGHRYGIAFDGSWGFWNTYRFPSFGYRIGYNYYGKLSGDYLVRLNGKNEDIKLFLGGRASAELLVNDILPFVNSEYSFMADLSLSPEFVFNYSKNGRWILEGSVYFPLAGVVARPDYAVTLRSYRITNIRFATLNRLFALNTRIGAAHVFKNSSRLGLYYSWQYKQYSYRNMIKTAAHKLTLLWEIKL